MKMTRKSAFRISGNRQTTDTAPIAPGLGFALNEDKIDRPEEVLL